jgi:hypothetical protein
MEDGRLPLWEEQCCARVSVLSATRRIRCGERVGDSESRRESPRLLCAESNGCRRTTEAKAKSSQNLLLHFNCTRLFSQKDKELASCLASS